MYADALDTYDNEMKAGQEELVQMGKEYEERAHDLKQLQEEWHHR